MNNNLIDLINLYCLLERGLLFKQSTTQKQPTFKSKRHSNVKTKQNKI